MHGQHVDAVEQAASNVASRLRGKVPSVKANDPVSRYPSFRLGGRAALFIEPASQEELSEVARACAEYELQALTIGRGSNLLVSDAGFKGAIIRLGKAFEWVAMDGALVSAGGAAPIPQVANWAARRSLSGLEFAIAIPASVGGAVRMNAGAHGSSISDVLTDATFCDMRNGSISQAAAADLQFSYRHSNIDQDIVVCSARFRLTEDDKASITAKMDRYRAHRARTQPAEAPNAGSMFKNPVDDSAGRLIESAGLKGLKQGNAQVSDKHANFFLAHEGATAQDVYDLMSRVQRAVSDNYGVLLEPEVRLVGTFDESAGSVIQKR
jgi:UDP-N-acetylmuramate dehydrogenase